MRIALVRDACLSLAVLAVYLASPLFYDQKVCLAAAQQAEFHGDFPNNVVESWNMRGLGHKLSVYALYKVSSVFVDYRDKAHFELAFRVVSSAVLIAILALGVLLARPCVQRYCIGSDKAFVVGWLGFFTLSYQCAFQAEDMSSWALVLGVACSLADRRALWVVGGLLLASTILFKGITIIQGMIGLAAVALLQWENQAKMWTVAASFAAGLLAIIATVALWAPGAIRDLMDATLFEATFEAGVVGRIKGFVATLIFGWPHFPIILGGIVGGAILFCRLFSQRKMACLATYGTIWFLAALVSLVQAKNFVYHFDVFVPIAVGSILGVLAPVHESRRWRWVAVVWVVPVLLCLICRFTNPIPLGRFTCANTNLPVLREADAAKRAEFTEVLVRFELDKQSALLISEQWTSHLLFHGG